VGTSNSVFLFNLSITRLLSFQTHHKILAPLPFLPLPFPPLPPSAHLRLSPSHRFHRFQRSPQRPASLQLWSDLPIFLTQSAASAHVPQPKPPTQPIARARNHSPFPPRLSTVTRVRVSFSAHLPLPLSLPLRPAPVPVPPRPMILQAFQCVFSRALTRPFRLVSPSSIIHRCSSKWKTIHPTRFSSTSSKVSSPTRRRSSTLP
jgi:hypothetical protein